MDAAWDNSGRPPKPQGMSLGAKVALGCGLTFLLLAGSCAACVGYGFKKGAGLMDQAWAEMHTDLQQLRTDEGTLALYAANPGLARHYPTSEAFLAAVTRWRGRLEALPAQRPSFKELVTQKTPLEVQFDERNGRKHLRLRYPMPQGGVLRLERENGRLLDIGVE